MTCIVGVRQNGRVWIGGDSAGVSDYYDLSVHADPKVFVVGEFLIGITWSWRMGQLLRFAFTPPPIDGDLYRYLCTTWVDAVRATFRTGGFASKENEVEQGGQFLVGVRGRLFRVHTDYSVEEPVASFATVGSGWAQALGALTVTAHLPPAARCRLALRAAEIHNTAVRGPFIIRSLPARGAR